VCVCVCVCDWGLNSGLPALLLEPYLQSILFWLFWRWDLTNYLPGLTSNCDLSHLNLPSS
jgi:hypothetical protein